MEDTRRENILAAVQKCATEVDRLHSEGYLVGKLLRFPGSVDNLLCSLVTENGLSYHFGFALEHGDSGFEMKVSLKASADIFCSFLANMQEIANNDDHNRKTIQEWFDFCALKLSPLCLVY